MIKHSTWMCALFLALGFGLPATAAQKTTQPTAEGVKAENLPEVRVGELSFKVTSLRISRYEGYSKATLTLTITNNGKSPIALNYKNDSGIMVNEHGYTWKVPNYGGGVSGLPVENGRSASTDYIIDPGSELRATLQLVLEAMKPGQTVGNEYNFQAVFTSFKDMGEGRLSRVRAYPVSFIGLKKSSMPEAAAQDLKDGVSTIEVDLKNALGRIFGK